MAEITSEFKAQFRSKYGLWGGSPPDFTRCAKSVPDGGRSFGSHQCTRKNGHGPHGAWCKQHDPIAEKEKADAANAKWRAEFDRERQKREFQRACIDAVKAIAEGHNDPRGLCLSVMEQGNRGDD